MGILVAKRGTRGGGGGGRADLDPNRPAGVKTLKTPKPQKPMHRASEGSFPGRPKHYHHGTKSPKPKSTIVAYTEFHGRGDPHIDPKCKDPCNVVGGFGFL